MIKTMIKFINKDTHDKKSFEDEIAALHFIRKNRDKIDSVNYRPIKVYDIGFNERDLSHFELMDIILGK